MAEAAFEKTKTELLDVSEKLSLSFSTRSVSKFKSLTFTDASNELEDVLNKTFSLSYSKMGSGFETAENARNFTALLLGYIVPENRSTPTALFGEQVAYIAFQHHVLLENEKTIRQPLNSSALTKLFNFGDYEFKNFTQLLKYVSVWLGSVYTQIEPLIPDFIDEPTLKVLLLFNILQIALNDYSNGNVNNTLTSLALCLNVFTMEPKYPFRELDNYYWDDDNKTSNAMARWIHTFVTWSNAYLAGAGDPEEVPRGMSCNIASLYLQDKDTQNTQVSVR